MFELTFFCVELTNQHTCFVSIILIFKVCLKEINKKIETLFGAERHYRFILGNLMRGLTNQPATIESVFCWILSAFYDFEKAT